MMSDRVSVSPRALVVGSTGRVGKRLISSLERMGDCRLFMPPAIRKRSPTGAKMGKMQYFLTSTVQRVLPRLFEG